MMTVKEISANVASVICSAAIIGGVTLYADVQITKANIANLNALMEQRETTTERFNQMLAQMDKTITIQSHSVDTLEAAVMRLEKFVMLAYENEKFKNQETKK